MNVAQKLIDYLRQSKEEVKKVSWPSRRDTIRYSALVIGVSVIMAVFFAGLDVGFQSVWTYIINKKTEAANQIQLTPESASTTNVTPTASTPSTSSPAVPDLNGATPLPTPDATKK